MEKLRSFYIDCASWVPVVNVDDFVVAVGFKKSNSVYHVFSVKSTNNLNKRLIRYHVKVFKSDLLTMLKRDKETQKIIPITWYKRNKKIK